MRIAVCCAALLLALPAFADIRTESVEYEHEGVTLEGYLAWDDAIEGKRPGVALIHEWWGLTEHPKKAARMLAEEGYIAFALDMYGKGKVTDDPGQAGEWATQFYTDPDLAYERMQAGLTVLREHPLSAGDQVAAAGFCFGGTMALQLARLGARIDGAASFHGGLETETPAKVDTLRAAILVMHGAADPMVPMEDVQAFINEMDAAEADWTLVMYGGAVHSFTNPEADERGMDGVAYDEDAAEMSWEHFEEFLEKLWGDPDEEAGDD